VTKVLVLWPEYFDSELTRSRGRRVPRRLASPGVGVQEVAEALRILGLRYEVQEAAYPRNWWERRGMVLVETDMKKSELLRSVAQTIKELRKSK